MIGYIFILLGFSSILFSFLISEKRGMYLFIIGFIVAMIGYFIIPKKPPVPIELKLKKKMDLDSIYLKGYKDGYLDCHNKSH